MGLGGGMKCVKCVVFFFNFIFVICGLGLVTVGVLVQLYLHNSFQIIDPSTSKIPIALIVIGVVVFFIAFFGCCGAWKENYCMVTTCAFLMSLMVVVEIATAIVIYFYRTKVETMIFNGLTSKIPSYINGTTQSRVAIDGLQRYLECCGMNSSADWEDIDPDKLSVPDSCCVKFAPHCGKGAMADPKKVFKESCSQAMKTFVENHFFKMIVAALVVAALQILGVAFSCVFMKGLREGYTVM